MNPADRANIERILEEQARLAGATGDMAFLGETQRLWDAPQPKPNFWEDPRYLHGPGSEAPMANAYRYGVTPPGEWGDLGGFDPDLTFGRALSEQGIEGWQNALAQVVLGVVEPGPGEIAQALSMLSGIPRALQVMIGKRIHPSLRDAEGLPIQQYHGTDADYDWPHRLSENYWSNTRGHHTTADPDYASDFGSGEGGRVRLDSPVVRRVLETVENHPMRVEEATDLKAAITRIYGGSVDDGVIQEAHRYVDRIIANDGYFTQRQFDDIFGELDYRYRKQNGPDAVRPTRQRVLETAGYEGYSDLDGWNEPEFLTFDPKRNIIRGNNPQDAIDWLFRQPDITPEEMQTITRIMSDLGLQAPR